MMKQWILKQGNNVTVSGVKWALNFSELEAELVKHLPMRAKDYRVVNASQGYQGNWCLERLLAAVML